MKLHQWKHDLLEAVQHYQIGTKLLWADITIYFRLLLKLASGKNLSRRERYQLTRTTSDIFRLVPFAVFIIVPLMELLLPVFLKLFPNMLPSTFQDKMKEHVLFSTTYISCFVSTNSLCDASFWDGVDGFWALRMAGSVAP